jgi:hypothetical protein
VTVVKTALVTGATAPPASHLVAGLERGGWITTALARIVSDDERVRPVSVSLRELAREAGVTAPAI